MVDKFDKNTRSTIMSKIKGKNTKPEIYLRHELSKRGYKYRINHKISETNIRPDLVFVSKRICIFVDGCFWHGCPVCYESPKTNSLFWKNKIKRNKQRDVEQVRYLRKHGWKVIRIWEHELKRPSSVNKILRIL